MPDPTKDQSRGWELPAEPDAPNTDGRGASTGGGAKDVAGGTAPLRDDQFGNGDLRSTREGGSDKTD